MSKGYDPQLYQIEQELEEEFQDRVYDNNALADSYDRLGRTNQAAIVRGCGTLLGYNYDVSPPRLVSANFCKDRLCGMCAWRRSKKVYGQVSQIMDVIEERGKFQYVFLSLTCRNCSGFELPGRIDLLFKAFGLFMKDPRVKAAFKGYFRTVEVTFNGRQVDGLQFHPHLHVIFAVRTSYFSKKLHYLEYEELRELWRHCLSVYTGSDIGYDPQIEVHKVKPRRDKLDPDAYTIKGAVCEISKYAVKYDTVFGQGYNQDQIDFAVMYLAGALKSRRLVAFGGIFKEIAAELKLDDAIDGDLVQTDAQKIRPDVGTMLVYYHWQVGFGYQFAGFKRLREEDLPEYGADQIPAATVQNDPGNIRRQKLFGQNSAVGGKLRRIGGANARSKASKQVLKEIESRYENCGVNRDLYERVRRPATGVHTAWVQGKSAEAFLDERGAELRRDEH